MTERLIVTAGLPYANGSLHLGHLVEYCQVDMYVRALKRMGRQALYICADDAHGTPIEMNAQRLGITPEALVDRYHREHIEHFALYDVAFDHYSITHSDTNRAIVERVYEALRSGGHIEERDVDGNWCPHDARFLPDRFIRGTCPRCKTADQYGDVCESCSATYSPTDLIDARCALCGNEPQIKSSKHLFFRLSDAEHTEFLRGWIDSGALKPDVANYVRNWIEGGLRDWCISRDGPYFGFAVPDRPGKYFYVWVDAPLGYASSSTEWGKLNGASFADLWQSPNTRIEHVIGKDIVYFHTLFWPALLRAVGFSLPDKVHVHGMLTVDGEKMSKSRGTFINASVFAEHVDPQALRYFYACKYTSQSDDLDLSLDDFVQRVNGELVNKHANLFSRITQFLHSRLGGKLGDLPFSPAEAREASTGDGSLLDLARRVCAHCAAVERYYREREFGQAMRELSAIADIGNEYVQEQKPWDQMKSDPEAARLTCTFAANICHALATYLWPVVPRFAERGAELLAADISRMQTDALFGERCRPIGEKGRLFERIDRKQIDAIVAASKTAPPQQEKSTPGAQTESKATASAKATAATKAAPNATGTPKATGGDTPTKSESKAESKAQISYDDFAKLQLVVGEVKAAEPVKKSKKLLKLQVDIGEAEPRQIIAGMAQSYAADELLGTRVVVLTNLAPAKLMGVESQGMILAGGEESDALALLRLDRPLPPGTQIR